MRALADRITATPVAFDRERAAAVLADGDPALGRGELGELIRGATGSSPYLARLAARHQDWLAEAVAQSPEAALDAILDGMRAAVDEAASQAAGQAPVRQALRRAKARAALLIALADLGGVWQLAEVTGALTRLADAAVAAAARWLLAGELRAGRLPGLDEAALETGAGYVLLAMGKMGAGELNFSSDIDLIALFDDARFGADDVLDARARYIHVTKQLVKLVSENTEDGYVFRTDLRLRPSPSTTPVCMAIDAAERYYESVGRTWERAAHIKARPLVDDAAGAAYLATLAPFIWRRHLDFAAIEDAHEMLRRIRAQKARFTAGELPGHDLKLGPGGIREIEFFVQTRQLIVGGREPALRVPTTLGGLDALVSGGWVEGDVRDVLAQDYRALRAVEHRLQMMEDAQTHAVPRSPDARTRLAMLSGEADRDAFERRLAERLARVHATCEEFFAPGAGRAPAPAETLLDEARLAERGFERPADAARQIARWHEGQIPATRGERARGLFRQLEPQIVDRLAGAASPDQALVHFDRFLSGLPAGVQLFSLFAANPQLLELIVEICAAAPRLALYLGRHPQTLDALLDRDFWEPMPGREAMAAELAARLAPEDGYERVLDASRRWAREAWFRAGVHVLRAIADEAEAGAAFTAIAETCIVALYPHVVADFARKHGAPPGQGLAVLAMGKLGSAEMTARSDLDLITVYDAGGEESSDGPRPLAPSVYYPRLTQALIAALTAPTAEGALYEVDMRLRPSGRQGPVAVSLASFDAYQTEKAWVWEHLALLRARVVAGPEALGAAIDMVVGRALAARRGAAEVMAEASAMRARIAGATAGERANPWSLKHAAGSLMEIEFLAQTGTLAMGLGRCRTARAALPRLAEAGWIGADAARDLLDALVFLQRLQQVERVALDGPLDPGAIGAELRRVLLRAAGAADFDALEAALVGHQQRAGAIVARVFGAAEGVPDGATDGAADGTAHGAADGNPG
jgi:glutamate-ammonia-ligase adenylyltransferase